MNRLSYSQISSLSASRHDQKPMPTAVPARKIDHDEPIKLLSMKNNPLEQSVPTRPTKHYRVKSSLEFTRTNLTTSTHDRKFNRVEHSHSPDIKHFDASPSFRRNEHLKLIESYEQRLGRLSQENALFQNQLFTDQQRYNQHIIDFELQIKNLESRLQTEILANQQSSQLIITKNNEIHGLHETLARLEVRYEELEHQCIIDSQNVSVLSQQLQQREIEIERLKKLLHENQTQHLKDIDDVRIKVETSLRMHYEIQIKDLQSSQQLNSQKYNEQLLQEQQKAIKLLSQNEQSLNEIASLNYSLSDIKLERDKLLDELNRYKRTAEDLKLSNADFSREVETLRERLHQLERNHQNALNDMKSHYEYMKRSQIEREIKDLTLKFQAERLTFEGQVRTFSQKSTELETRNRQYLEINEQLNLKIRGLEEELKHFVNDHEHYKRIKGGEIDALMAEIAEYRTSQQESSSKLASQASEISRLHQVVAELKLEIEQQKRRGIELESTLKDQFDQEITEVNVKFSEERKFFEQQAGELRTRNIQLEGVVKQKDEQILGHSKQQLFLAGQIEQLNQKLQTQAEQQEHELADYQAEMEGFKKDLRDQQTKLQTERNHFEQQLKAAKQKITELESRLIELQYLLEQEKSEHEDEGTKLKKQIERLQGEKSQLEQQLRQQKERSNAAAMQLGQLEQMNALKDQEIEELKKANESDRAQFVQKQLQLEGKLQQARQLAAQQENDTKSSRMELEEAYIQIQKLEKLLEQFKEDQKRRETESGKEVHQLKLRIEEVEQEILERQTEHGELQDTIETLQKQILGLQDEVKTWQRRYSELEQEWNSHTEEINVKMQYYQKLELDQQDLELKFQAERNAYENRIELLEQQKDQAESRVDKLTREYKNLESQLSEKFKEVESLKQKLNQNYVSNDEYEALKVANQKLQAELQVYEESQIKVTREQQQLKKQNDTLLSDLESREDEHNQLKKLIEKRKTESEDQIRRNEALQKEIQRLNHDLVEQKAQLGLQGDQLNLLNNDKSDLEDQVSNLKRQLKETQEQLKLRNQEVVEKVREIDVMKQKYEDQWRRGSIPTEHVTQKVTTTSVRSTLQVQVENPLDDNGSEGSVQIKQIKSQRHSQNSSDHQ